MLWVEVVGVAGVGAGWAIDSSWSRWDSRRGFCWCWPAAVVSSYSLLYSYNAKMKLC